MTRLAITGCACGLLYGATVLNHQPQLQVTTAPHGPFRVAGNRIVDAGGHSFLIRGTQVAEFRVGTAAYNSRSGNDFGPHSGTALSAIRLRFNMNAVRVPLNVADGAAAGYWTQLAELVRRANEIELLVILAGRGDGEGTTPGQTAEFWSHCAAYFKDYPNVMFEAQSAGGKPGRRGMADLVRAIRGAGAAQPILAMNWTNDRSMEGAGELLDDGNMVYEVSLSYSNTRTEAERDAHLGLLAKLAPVVANDWDLRLDDAAACAAIPSDPTAATEMVQDNLNYFDAHGISWTVSSYEPGKLIQDNSRLDGTTLENGWTCGHATADTGLGRVLQAHMRSTVERGLFVTGTAGGNDVARGGYAIAYGPVMAARDASSSGPRLPLALGGVTVQITDRLGATRPAGIYWAAAGWGQINFVVPGESAIGPARMTILRADGSRTGANFIVADTAPGFFTHFSCRGPAVGTASQVFADGRRRESDISFCVAPRSGSKESPFGDCRARTIPMTNGATTRVRLKGSGFRNAGSAADIEVTIAGARVRVVSFGPTGEQGVDQLTIEIPAALRGLGEADLLCHVNGRVSNAVRIGIGGEKPAS